MREFVYGRNPIYETLKAKRREAFVLQIAEGVQEKGRMTEILDLAAKRKIPTERVTRARLDKISESHQGVALEVSGYPYVAPEDIFENARKRDEPLFILILDTLQNPQNLGTLLRTAEAVGIHGVLIPTHRAAGNHPGGRFGFGGRVRTYAGGADKSGPDHRRVEESGYLGGRAG